MPILNFHLVQGQHTAAKVETLLLKASALFAEVLACPIERVRVFVTEHAPQHFCVGGKLVSQHDQVAPYFSFILLEGRSQEDRQRLLSGFTDLLVDILGAPRANVRGGIVPVAPADWSIGGTPANQLRQAEIEARRLAAAAN
ncbi:MAG: tautomerase family protein [Betaproteobacteria bacterium]|jgi:4-oxalocrotonate tautomerase family enzyme|nr:tautomerase family protein [Betaproteobacteria bacterium]MBK8317427.1 tautomerase family protein [Betaproteobacteria bacterium]